MGPSRSPAGDRRRGHAGQVLVADTEPLYALGVVTALARAGIAGQAMVAPETLARSSAHSFAGIVVDSRLGADAYARDLVAAVASRRPGLAVVVTVDRPRPAGIVQVMEAGARALVHRRCTGEEMAAAVHAALLGTDWLSAPLAALMRSALVAEVAGEPAGELTPRERDVLRGLAAGGSNAEIGRRLGISEHTVRNHVHTLMGKLGAGNRTDALATAARLGLVELLD